MSQLHEELQALAPGYVLGVLDADERQLFEEHLSGCPQCTAEVRALVGAVDALARSVPQRMPPADLRERVMSSVRHATTVPPERAAVPNPWWERRVWLPVTASVMIALGAGIYGSHLHVETRLAALGERAEATDREIAAARREAVNARSAMEVLAAPDVLRIDLKGQGPAVNATARVLWSRQRGMVFAGTNLPTPPPDRCYQVWFMTGSTAISAGILSDPRGEFAVLDTPADAPQPVTVTVTLEPVGGVPAPTGVPVLVGSRPASF